MDAPAEVRRLPSRLRSQKLLSERKEPSGPGVASAELPAKEQALLLGGLLGSELPLESQMALVTRAGSGLWSGTEMAGTATSKEMWRQRRSALLI